MAVIPYKLFISIHAPPRGATCLFHVPFLRSSYFNSRPSARGDEIGTHKKDCEQISIHAPPRGATRRYCTAANRKSISIHAPPRGATPVCQIFEGFQLIFQFTPLREGRRLLALARFSISGFQFTPLREGRLACFMCPSYVLPISIHAPPRGATLL